MKKELIATYNSLKAFYNQPSTIWLTIAEFIDNSISSWQGKNNYDSSLEGLIIEIFYDISDEKNNKLIIIDNARGMSENELVEAMQPFNPEGKSSSDYNQYGVGMKFGCFYNGQDACIYSKKANDNEYYVSLKTSDKKGGEPVFVESHLSTKNFIKNSGTMIIIENLYENRLPSNKVSEIREALGWRYNKLINDKNLKILFGIKNSDIKSYSNNKITEIEPFFNKPFNLLNFNLKIKKNPSEDLSKRIKKQKNDILKILNDDNHKNKKILLEFCNKILKDEDLVVYVGINVNNQSPYAIRERYILDDKENLEQIKLSQKFNAILKVGVLEKRSNYQKYSGVTTYHIKRAINHGPNGKNHSANIQFLKKEIGSGGDPTWRRLFGEIDLTNIEVPDQNKSRFNWSPNGEEELQSVLEKIHEEVKELLKLMIDWENDKESDPKRTKKDIQEIVECQSNVVNHQVIRPIIESGDALNTKNASVLYEINGFNKKIRIIEISGNDNNFINISHNERDVLNVTINVNSEIWKPFINNTKENMIFRGKSVYTIVLMIVISNELISGDEQWKNFFINQNGVGNQELKLFQIINNVLDKIRKIEE